MQSNGKKRNKPNIKKRVIKITSEVQRLAHGKVKFVPYIRLRGDWLQRVGFPVGQQVKIRVLKDRLIITPYNPGEK